MLTAFRTLLVVILAALIALASRIELPARLQESFFEYQRHPRLSYALAFIFAPHVEVLPAPLVRKRVPEPGECRDGCLVFRVTSDAEAVDAAMELEDGTRVRPTITADTLRFQLDVSAPTRARLTWTPQVFDPGFGSGFIGCGQSLSDVAPRAERLGHGRVGVALLLRPIPGDLTYELLGDKPYVP